jgi:hypothetical protein
MSILPDQIFSRQALSLKAILDGIVDLLIFIFTEKNILAPPPFLLNIICIFLS